MLTIFRGLYDPDHPLSEEDIQTRIQEEQEDTSKIEAVLDSVLCADLKRRAGRIVLAIVDELRILNGFSDQSDLNRIHQTYTHIMMDDFIDEKGKLHPLTNSSVLPKFFMAYALLCIYDHRHFEETVLYQLTRAYRADTKKKGTMSVNDLLGYLVMLDKNAHEGGLIKTRLKQESPDLVN